MGAYFNTEKIEKPHSPVEKKANDKMLFLISELSQTQNSKLQESGTSEFYLGLKLTREMALFFTLFDVPRRFVVRISKELSQGSRVLLPSFLKAVKQNKF